MGQKSTLYAWLSSSDQQCTWCICVHIRQMGLVTTSVRSDTLLDSLSPMYQPVLLSQAYTSAALAQSMLSCQDRS